MRAAPAVAAAALPTVLSLSTIPSAVPFIQRPAPMSYHVPLASVPLRSSPDDWADGGDGGEEDTDGPSLYAELRRAASERLGAPLPEDAVRESAAASESEFLAAMREASEEFEAAKAERGSDGAVEMFLRRIDEEERAVVVEGGEGFGNDGEDGADGGEEEEENGEMEAWG